jgi:membrane protease subunit HflC
MRYIRKVFLPIFIIILLGIFACFYSVREGQRALLLKLGKIVMNSSGQPLVIQPGLHLRVPFINQVHTFDVRLQTLDAQSSRVLTEEQKYVLVDYYVKWKIADLPLYYTRTDGFANKAETLLQQKVNDSLRAAFGKQTITEVVSDERGNVMDLLKQKADESAKDLGIEVIDVRIKRIDLPEEVSDSVFSRMRVEREQAATRHRSDGNAKAESIKAEADASVTVILAKAQEKAAKIRAQGDAKAAEIYANAYKKDADFYALYRSLQAYKNVFINKNDVLLLKPDSQFFKYFNNTYRR